MSKSTVNYGQENEAKCYDGCELWNFGFPILIFKKTNDHHYLNIFVQAIDLVSCPDYPKLGNKYINLFWGFLENKLRDFKKHRSQKYLIRDQLWH